jgi:HD superfamily phosphodiesterase
VDVPVSAPSLRHMGQQARARQIARTLLAGPLPRRWAHTQGVARRARSLAAVLGDEATVMESAAWLHDIGYAPALAVTGFHPLDGARYLRDVEHAAPVVCALVAYHSGALAEACERGLAPALTAEFAPVDGFVADALTYCDLTTSPDGHPVQVTERLREIQARYGPAHRVSRVIRRISPQLLDAV